MLVKKSIILSIVFAINFNSFGSQNRTITSGSISSQQAVLLVMSTAIVLSPIALCVAGCKSGSCRWEKTNYPKQRKQRVNFNGGNRHLKKRAFHSSLK